MTDTIRGFAPSSRLVGPMTVPGSKSLAQRALVIAGLADGPTRIGGVPRSADVLAARAALSALGVGVLPAGPGSVTVDGMPPGPGGGWGRGDVEAAPDVGESGTAARLLTAVAAFCGHAGSSIRIEGRGSLLTRRSAALFAALRQAGVDVHPLGQEEDGWPVRLGPVGPPSDLLLRDPASSQEVSGLLIAAAAWPDEIRLVVEGQIPSSPYVDLTRHVLRQFGVEVGVDVRPAGITYHIPGPLQPPQDPLLIEPDASAAGIALVAGCLSGGGVQVKGLTLASPQGDVRVIEHLRAFGVDAGEDHGALFATGTPTRGAHLDLAGEPDLAPPLAAMAGAAALGGHRTFLGGLGTLPGKESSRIEVLARGLEAIGLRTEVSDAALVVAPGRRGSAPVLLDAAGDHRMAFAFALLGLLGREVRVSGAQHVSKSWPTFWEDAERAGAKLLS